MVLALPEDIEEVVFLTKEEVLFLQAELLNKGQLTGVKSHDNLDSAIGRVHTAAYYDSTADFAKLAAYYWHGISANHGFHDGNKRAGFAAMVTFLEINGFEFMGSDRVMAQIIYGLFKENAFTVDRLEQLVRMNTRILQ